MGGLFPLIALLVLDVVGRSSVSAILCYKCGMTEEKVVRYRHIRSPWPEGEAAEARGLVDCGQPPHDRFLQNCTGTTRCHTLEFEGDQFTPIRFCFSKDTSCDNLIIKLKGNPICNECFTDRCNGGEI